MKGTLALVGGAGLGAGIMYLLDPDRGGRRRTALGVSLAGAMNDAADRLPAVAGAAVDAVASARQTSGRFDGPRFVSSLAERLDVPQMVRGVSMLRPEWRDGRLTLWRPDQGFVHGHRWSLLGLAAGVLAAGLWGLWRREAGQVRAGTTIDAPAERVFDAWSRFEDFPRFMPMVAEVRPAGEDRHHWVIAGVAGAPIAFDSVVTRRERPRVIGWTTVEGATVEHGGIARLRPAGDGTRLEVTMWWRPADGALDDGVAFVSGLDPGRALRETLQAFKARLEAEPVAR